MKFDESSNENVESLKKLLQNPISIDDLGKMLNRYGNDEDVKKDKEYRQKVKE